MLSRARCLVRQRQVCAAIKLSMVALVGVGWASSPLDTLALLVRVGVLTAGTSVAGDVIGLPVHLVSE